MQAVMVAALVALSAQLNGGDKYAGAAPGADGGSAVAVPLQVVPQQTTPAQPLQPQPDPANGLGSQIESPTSSSNTPTLAPPPAGADQPSVSVNEQPPAATAPPKSVVATPPASSGPKATDLIRSFARTPTAGQLAGTPLRLADALRGAANREDQSSRAEAYWELSSRVLDYYLALREAMELQALRQGLATASPLWEARQADLDARVALARDAAEAAQWRMQQRLGRGEESTLPLPDDLPHCGRYDTRYAEIFAARPDPAAKKLNDLLPLRYDQLQSCTRAVTEAYDWLTEVRQQSRADGGGADVLRAHDSLALRRRALVSAVAQYNLDIVAYTRLAAPREVPSDHLVSMMIQVSNPGASGWSPSDGVQTAAGQPNGDGSAVRPASADEPTTVSPNSSGNYRQVRRPPFWRFRQRERSIVVDRLLPRLRLRD